MTETALESYLAKVLDTINEGVAIIGGDGRYTFANEAAERILCAPKEAIIGRRYDDPVWMLTALDGTSVPAEEMPAAIVLRTGEPVLDVLYRATPTDGRQIVLSINATPFDDAEGRLVGAAISFNDVTRRVRVEQLDKALGDISSAVYSSFDFDTIVQTALDRGVDALGCESGVIFLDEDTDWVMRYLRHLPDDLIGARVPAELASFTLLTGGEGGGAIAYNDAYRDERISSRLMRRYKIKSMLDVTMRVRGRDVADMSFIYHSKAVPFTEDDVDFANKLGAIVALALENARRFEVEHHIADRLQEALLTLPESIGGIEFAHAYHSATEAARVGGDFYDIFEMNHHHVGILIGDVAGKGLDAAVLTSLVKNTIRAHAMERGKTPSQILALTNEVVFKATPSESFVTVFFGILDCRDGRLVYSNAGHTSAAVVRHDGGVTRLRATGPLVGAFDEAEFQQDEVRLDLDLLFLYTDGLTEARSNGEQYGEDRVFETLASAKARQAAQVVGTLVDDVVAYTENCLRDDLAIFAVRRSEHGLETPVQQKLTM